MIRTLVVVNRVLYVTVVKLLMFLPLLGRQVEEVAGGIVDNPDTDGADQRNLEPGNKENLQPEVSIFIHNSASTHGDESSAKVLESLQDDKLLQIILLHHNYHNRYGINNS